MPLLLRSFIVATLCVTALIPSPASAQNSSIDARTSVADVRLFSDGGPVSPHSALGRRQGANGDRDSVLDGLFIGAGLGAAGGAFGAWLWCQGDYKGECDDEPGQGALVGRTALISAGVGAVLGWVFDLNRSTRHEPNGKTMGSSGPTLVVAPIASPSVKALHLTLRY